MPAQNSDKRRLIVGISGARGMPLALCLLQTLQRPEIELHLIISSGAMRVMQEEGGVSAAELALYAHTVHPADDMAAGPASGSWRNDGMIICPCSMSSLAAIACGAGVNLLHRAADVTLKEHRPLVIVPRETPLNLIHLDNMRRLAAAGAVIMPFMPAFYTSPDSVDDLLRQFCGRLLDQFGLHSPVRRWRDEA